MTGAEPSGGKSIAQQALVNSLGWLISLRWVAAAGVIGGTAFAVRVLGVPVPEARLYLLGFSIFLYNAGLVWGLKLLNSRYAGRVGAYQWFARAQIGLDWVGMAVLIHYSGGVESPAILFYLFHIPIASLLLPHDRGFLYVTLGPGLIGSVALMEYAGLLPHVYLVEAPLHEDPIYVAGVLFFFTCSCYVMAYFSMTISRRLRRREREVAGLYESVRAATSTLELQTVLNRLAEATAQALRCKGASIRLLDKPANHLEMVASHGLSQAYMEKAPIELAKARIDREALQGRTVLVTDAPDDPRVRYPDKIRAEGIRTILSAPLMGTSGALGVLRAYGGEGHFFEAEDAAFLEAVASHGAVAIEHALAYQMLLQLDREKSRFLRTVTHELRSPANAIASLLGVLQKGFAGSLGAKQADLVERAAQRARFLQALVDDLLDLAAGKAQVLGSREREPVSLSKCLEECASRFEPLARAKGVELRRSLPEGELRVWADPAEVDRILVNLIGNAVKYTRSGHVEVSLAGEGDSARLEVRDTGIGIPDSARAHLFEEFYRAPNARDCEERGTGLGLAIVKDLVEKYGGSITMEGQEGRGTVFTVLLPRVQEEAVR